jgi:microcystin-dependent protein
MARTIKLDTVTHPSNSGTANQTLDSSGQTSFPTVDINGGAIDNCTIGGSTAGAGTFTTVTSPIVQPTSGQSLIVKEEGGTTAITVDTSGNATFANNVSVNGNTTIGNASSDSLTITATASGSANFSGLTGEIRMYGGTSEPSGWKFCNNQTLNTYTFAALHAVVSNTYGGTAYNAGVTDQSGATTTFNVPDFRGRVPLGVNPDTLTQRVTKALGASGGTSDVTLTAAQSGVQTHGHANNFTATHAHTHDLSNHVHSLLEAQGGVGSAHVEEPYASDAAATDGGGNTLGPEPNVTGAASTNTVTISGGVTDHGGADATQAHNNLQPYLTVNYIIKT